MINVGIIGFGLSGRYLQAPFFITNKRYSLKKIATSQSLPSFGFHDIEQVRNPEDIIEDPNIDLVSVCSPNPTHYQYAKSALLAGKHVLIEKPITPRLAMAQELFELADSKGLTISVFQNRRYDSDFLTVKNVIESGILGRILSYEAHFDRFKPILNPKAWKETPTEGVGLLYDLGAHLIDQAIVLFGRPDQISGETFIQREGSSVDDGFDLKLNFNGVRVQLKSSLMVKDQGPKYIVHGTLGSFTKYGMDIQEDQLVGGICPDSPDFGIEPKEFSGKIKTSLSGLEIEGNITTLQGDWNSLFNNLADTIEGKDVSKIHSQEILWQMEVYEKLKYGI